MIFLFLSHVVLVILNLIPKRLSMHPSPLTEQKLPGLKYHITLFIVLQEPISPLLTAGDSLVLSHEKIGIHLETF